ncbi:ABC transporter substrate-binding protein [Actinomycetes bacterium M1A6_2h]
MRRSVAVAAVAIVTAGTALSACSSAEDKVPSIGYAIDNTVSTYNAGTTAGSVSGAPQAFSRVLPGFSYLGPEGVPLADTDIGTATTVPGDTLTVAYTLSPASVWSDGVPMGCEDLVLAWTARNGKVRGADGAAIFDAASTAGYADIDRIDCTTGSKNALVHFASGRNFVDWRSLFGATSLMPAHIATAVANVPDLPVAVADNDTPSLERVAQMWNTGWNLTPGQFDPANFPSAGPYRIESYTAEDGLVLVPNEAWWGRAPETERIVVWPDGTDIAAKVTSSDVEVIDSSAGAASPAGFADTVAPGWGIEQLVFATTGVFQNSAARRAFASCVPRTQLFDDGGSPDYDTATAGGRGTAVVDSRMTVPGSLVYPTVAATAGERYRQPDAAAATTGFAGAGVPNPTVRIGYLAPDDARRDLVAAIASACKPAGVTVVDAGSDRFVPTDLGAGQVDAILAGTAGQAGATGSALGGADRFALRTGQGTNFGRYSNARIDAIVDQLAVDDSDATQASIGTEAENILWNDMPTLPLFNAPRKTSTASGVENAMFNPTTAGTGWNMDRWVLLR